LGTGVTSESPRAPGADRAEQGKPTKFVELDRLRRADTLERLHDLAGAVDLAQALDERLPLRPRQHMGPLPGQHDDDAIEARRRDQWRLHHFLLR
jgi:hypothetical protein